MTTWSTGRLTVHRRDGDYVYIVLPTLQAAVTLDPAAMVVEDEAVGLTAAFSHALGEAGISCNVTAGYHHDHLLVPSARADEAVEARLP